MKNHYIVIIWLILGAPVWMGAGCAEEKPEPTLELLTVGQMHPARLHYWDAKAPNAIYIHHNRWNATFTLHLFEDLLVPSDEWPERHFKNKRRLNEELFKWERVDPQHMRFSMKQEEVVRFELEGEVRTEQNKVIVQGIITNQSEFPWSGRESNALMCLRSHLVEDFHDTQGTRIYLVREGLDEPLRVYDLVGTAYYPYFNFFVLEKPLTFHPLLIKENVGGTRRITFESTPVLSLSGNREPFMSCIHTNYALSAKPGEKMDFYSSILFEDVLSPAKDLISSPAPPQ